MNVNVIIVTKEIVNEAFIEDLKSSFPTSEDNPNWTEEGLKKLLSSGGMLLLGYVGDKIAGFLYGYTLQKPDGKKEFYVHELGTNSEFRRQSVMKNIFEFLFSELKNRGISTAWTLTEPENKPAASLYSSLSGKRKEQVLFEFEVI